MEKQIRETPMKSTVSFRHRMSISPFGRTLLLALGATLASSCAQGEPEMPSPRPIVIRSGERLYADQERMREVDSWFRAQQDNITNDPSFWVITVGRDTPSYPWESLYLSNDTASIGVQLGFPEAERVYQVYAHYHLMEKMGRIGEFLPGGENLEGFALERAILARISDAWFLARAVYQAVAFNPLEEILYSNENGYLDALILTARGDEFRDERQAWLMEDPEAQERYRKWFQATFNKEPPGLR
jgi:hypothetical protein